MIAYIMDASVGIKTVVDESQSNSAAELLEHLVTNPTASCFVPDLFYAECANILWKYTKRFNLPPDQAREGLALLSALNLTAVPMTELAAPALNIALKYGISAYDACYLALAELQRLPLVTADQRLANCLAGSPYQIYTLDDCPFISADH